MKKKLLTIILLISSSITFAQGVYNNGGKIILGTGATMNITGAGGNYRNETNATDGSLDLNGTLKIEGNMINNVAASDIFSSIGMSGSVIFAGNAQQTVGGLTTAIFTFGNLTVNNNSGILFAKNAQVNGSMTLTAGLVDIGNNNFTFGTSAVVSGSPSAANMIIATGSGQVIKNFSGTGSFTYPVGDNNVAAKYSPVTLNFTAGTFGAGASAGLNLVNAKYNDPLLTGSYLNRYWNISQTGITGFTADAMFQYDASDVVGTEAGIYCLSVAPPPIKAFDPANTTLHQLTANGLTSFGTFTAGIGFKTLNLSSVMLEGLYNGLGLMKEAWNASGPNWGTGIADHVNIELHDATVYGTVALALPDVPLTTSGSVTVSVPVNYNNSYYITVKHRNSIETTTATAISFAGSTVSQSFGAPANVFGSNLKLSGDGYYLVYGGDVNQDGVVDTRDYIGVDNDSFNFASGYLVTDVNGDGVIDTRDFIIIDNNNANFVGTSHP